MPCDQLNPIQEYSHKLIDNLPLFYQYQETQQNIQYILQVIHTIKKNINMDFELKEADKLIIIKLIRNNLITSNPFTKTLAGIPYEMFF